MILDALQMDPDAFARATGWVAKPEGLCQGDVCVPAPGAIRPDGRLDATVVADRLRMPLVHDEAHGTWALGPPAEDAGVTSVEVPDLTLPTVDGEQMSLASMRGRRVIMVAWASW